MPRRILTTPTKSNNSNSNDDNCVICRESLSNNNECATIENCDHKYHQTCIDTWVKISNSCPLCKCEVKNYFVNDKKISVKPAQQKNERNDLSVK